MSAVETLNFNNDGTYTYTPNVLFSGSDSFTFHAEDGSLSSTIETVNITVNDTMPPQIAISNDVGSGPGVSGLTTVSPFQFNGTCNSDATTLEAYYEGGLFSFFADSDCSDGDWDIGININLPDGTHEFLIRAFDAAGNSSEAAMIVTVDTTYLFTVTSHNDGDTIHSSTVVFTGNCDPDGQNFLIQSIAPLLVLGTYSDTDCSDGTWMSDPLPVVPDFTNQYQLQSRDSVGNIVNHSIDLNHVTLPLPPNPINLAFTNVTDFSMDLEWESMGGATTGFRIAMSPMTIPSNFCDGANGGITYDEVTVGGDPTLGSVSSFSFNSLVPNVNYNFRVCSVNGSGDASEGAIATQATSITYVVSDTFGLENVGLYRLYGAAVADFNNDGNKDLVQFENRHVLFWCP